jgi:hypothetical protein
MWKQLPSLAVGTLKRADKRELPATGARLARLNFCVFHQRRKVQMAIETDSLVEPIEDGVRRRPDELGQETMLVGFG